MLHIIARQVRLTLVRTSVLYLLFVLSASAVSAQSESLELRDSASDRAMNGAFSCIQVEDHQDAPSAAGRYWNTVKQKASIFFTFDTVKKVQKMLSFAHENLELAELVMEQTGDAGRVQKLIATANGYLDKLDQTKDQWLAAFGSSPERDCFLHDLELHLMKRDAILEKISNSAAESGQEDAVNLIREKAEETVKQLQDTIAANRGTGAQTQEPQVVNASDDFDGDGLPNEEEAQYGTSPRDLDTDGDTLSDAIEIQVWGTDPLNPDTDGDGFRDGLEVLKGYNPLGEGSLPQS